MPATNKAAFLDAKGTPLRVGDIAMPNPGPDQLVIRNHAVTVNPADWKIQDHAWFVMEWPVVLGQDVAGEVYEVGSNVTKFKKGDRVISHTSSLLSGKRQEGGFQHYSAAPAATTAIIPDSVSFQEASVLPLAIDTAAHGIYSPVSEGFLGLDYPSLNPKSVGKTFVLWGGSSSVGTLVIQLAVASGATVIATASSHNHDFVRKLGATEVFDYKSSTVVEDVVKATKTAGGEFIGVYDAVSSADSYPLSFEVSQKLGGGNVVITMAPPEEVPAGIKVGNIFAIHPTTYPVWERYVEPALAQGKLKCAPEPLVVGKGLEFAQKGLDLNRKGVSAKKVVMEL